MNNVVLTSEKITLKSINSLPSSRRINLSKRIFQALLLILFNLFLIEVFARFVVVLSKPVETIATSYDLKYQMAKNPINSPHPQLLILGDSLGEFGIYPEWLSHRLALKGYNASVISLASPGNTPDRSLFLLKTALQHGYKPKLILYNIHPRIFNANFMKDPEQTGETIFQQSYVGHCLYHASTNPVQCALEKQFYSIRYRDYFKKLLLSLSDDYSHTSSLTQYNHERNRAETDLSERGWSPGYSVYNDNDFQKKYSQIQILEKIKPDFQNFAWNSQSFKNLYDYSQKEKMPFILVWLPEQSVTDSYYKHFKLSKKVLAQRITDYANNHQISFLNFHDSLPGAENYQDPDHLNVHGAITLSQNLAEQLQKDPLKQFILPFKYKASQE